MAVTITLSSIPGSGGSAGQGGRGARGTGLKRRLREHGCGDKIKVGFKLRCEDFPCLLASDALAGADGFVLKQVSGQRDANYLSRQIHLALARRRLKRSLGVTA